MELEMQDRLCVWGIMKAKRMDTEKREGKEGVNKRRKTIAL